MENSNEEERAATRSNRTRTDSTSKNILKFRGQLPINYSRNESFFLSQKEIQDIKKHDRRQEEDIAVKVSPAVLKFTGRELTPEPGSETKGDSHPLIDLDVSINH